MPLLWYQNAVKEKDRLDINCQLYMDDFEGLFEELGDVKQRLRMMHASELSK